MVVLFWCVLLCVSQVPCPIGCSHRPQWNMPLASKGRLLSRCCGVSLLLRATPSFAMMCGSQDLSIDAAPVAGARAGGRPLLGADRARGPQRAHVGRRALQRDRPRELRRGYAHAPRGHHGGRGPGPAAGRAPRASLRPTALRTAHRASPAAGAAGSCVRGAVPRAVPAAGAAQPPGRRGRPRRSGGRSRRTGRQGRPRRPAAPGAGLRRPGAQWDRAREDGAGAALADRREREGAGRRGTRRRCSGGAGREAGGRLSLPAALAGRLGPGAGAGPGAAAVRAQLDRVGGCSCGVAGGPGRDAHGPRGPAVCGGAAPAAAARRSGRHWSHGRRLAPVWGRPVPAPRRSAARRRRAST
jgi:hypothetical protein